MTITIMEAPGMVIIFFYLLFVELEFSSYLIAASPKFCFGYTRHAKERAHYVNYKSWQELLWSFYYKTALQH